MTRESDSKAERLETKINYKIIAMMVAFTIAYYVYGYLNQDYVINNFTVLNIIPFLTTPLGVGIAGIIVAKRYWKTEIFGKAYLSLGIAYILWWLGSSLYEYYDFIEIDPYPSIADVFFIAMFPFLYYHIILNTKPFYKSITKYAKVSVWIIAVALVILYTSMTLPEGTSYDLDFYISEINIVIEAVLLALVILGALVFSHSVLGNVWVLLVIGLSIFTFADYWYYYTEEQYDKSHPSNAIWNLSFMILIYALYKHNKAI